ncbi:hypothetical protein AMTRI_Chr04g245680 [Amborella trichopoda]
MFPFIGTTFLFLFVSNWSGALLPLKIIELPRGELVAPTNDINTIVALALPMSVAYFYAGISKKGLGYFGKLYDYMHDMLLIRYVRMETCFCYMIYAW